MVCSTDPEGETEVGLEGLLAMPISWAMAMTLSSPTLVERRTNAQLTEPAVASQMSM